jgi:hypothetical protein
VRRFNLLCLVSVEGLKDLWWSLKNISWINHLASLESAAQQFCSSSRILLGYAGTGKRSARTSQSALFAGSGSRWHFDPWSTAAWCLVGQDWVRHGTCHEKSWNHKMFSSHRGSHMNLESIYLCQYLLQYVFINMS